jgi:HAD superfamily hydrolase (TIGR01509 family)
VARAAHKFQSRLSEFTNCDDEQAGKVNVVLGNRIKAVMIGNGCVSNYKQYMACAAPPEFDLVIFDCDGVLVDSENLSAEVLTELLAQHGIAIDAAAFRSDFLGRSFMSASERLRQRTGKTLVPDFHDRYLERLLQTFSNRLQSMAGVENLLAQLAVRKCVASSSNPQRLTHSLACSGLASWFGGDVFSGVMVEKAKPAPDLFLLAAQCMAVEPKRCLVIEDSEMGLLAGRAAGMTVWHFRGGSHFLDGLGAITDAPCDGVANDMWQLLDMFIKAGLCVPSEGKI